MQSTNLHKSQQITVPFPFNQGHANLKLDLQYLLFKFAFATSILNFYKQIDFLKFELIIKLPNYNTQMTEKKDHNIMLPDEIISSKIYLIRGQRVMLDKDLAELYEVETRTLNQAVNRNIERFPEMFMFRLTQPEFEILKSQFVTSSWGGTRKLPYVFTEQGVAMLSSVLRSKKAIQVNIQIIMVFTKIREMLVDTFGLKLDIEEIKKRLTNQDKNIELVFSYLDELMEKQENPKPRKQIGYKRENKKG